MIVADTSALLSLASIDLLETFLSEFDVHTTDTVIRELEETASCDDRHGDAAHAVLNNSGRMTMYNASEAFTSSRVDRGEGSCAALANDEGIEFLITDDLRALPELQTVTDTQVAISPIVLKALVQRGVLEQDEAVERLDELAEQRDWLGAPIYRRAESLLDRLPFRE
jgi:predicted nucleic acid-binding protein